MQNVVGTILITAWLGGLGSDSLPGEIGRRLSIEEVGELLQGKSRQPATTGSTGLRYVYVPTNNDP